MAVAVRNRTGPHEAFCRVSTLVVSASKHEELTAVTMAAMQRFLRIRTPLLTHLASELWVNLSSSALVQMLVIINAYCDCQIRLHVTSAKICVKLATWLEYGMHSTHMSATRPIEEAPILWTEVYRCRTHFFVHFTDRILLL